MLSKGAPKHYSFTQAEVEAAFQSAGNPIKNGVATCCCCHRSYNNSPFTQAEVEAAFQSAGNPIKNGGARCLCHDDRNPSMSVSVKDGKLLVNCFSPECSKDEVYAAAVKLVRGDNYRGMSVSVKDGKLLVYCSECSQDEVFKAAVNLVRGDSNVLQLPLKKKTPPAKPQKDFSREWDSYRQTGEAEFLYCKKKGVKPYGLRLAPGGHDAMPMRANGGTGVVVGIQLRSDKDVFGYDGDKRDMHSLKDSAKTGGAHIVGELTPGVQVAVCEGYATAASVYEATGIVSACAFGVGNVIGVVEALRAQGYQPFCVFDDDTAGHKEAAKAQSMGLRAILPSFDGVEGRQAKKKKPDEWEDNDFNDLAKLAGAGVVKAQVLAGLAAPLPEVDQVELPAARKSKKRACREDYIGLLEATFRGRKPRRDIFTGRLHVWLEDPECGEERGKWVPFMHPNAMAKLSTRARESNGFFLCGDKVFLDYYLDYETTLKPELLLDIEEWDGVDWVRPIANAVQAKHLTHDQLYEIFLEWSIKVYRRIFDPEVQNEALIFIGGQGIGKDRYLIGSLIAPWGRLTCKPLLKGNGNETELGQMACEFGILHLAEYDRNKKSPEEMKNLITMPEATWRPVYERVNVTKPTRASVIGSANVSEICSDPTGARRFNIVEVVGKPHDKCQDNEVPAIHRGFYEEAIKNKGQLLAQVVHMSKTWQGLSEGTKKALEAVRDRFTPQDDVEVAIEQVFSEYQTHADRHNAVMEQVIIGGVEGPYWWVSNQVIGPLIAAEASANDVGEKAIRIRLQNKGYAKRRHEARGYYIPVLLSQTKPTYNDTQEAKETENETLSHDFDPSEYEKDFE